MQSTHKILIGGVGALAFIGAALIATRTPTTSTRSPTQVTVVPQAQTTQQAKPPASTNKVSVSVNLDLSNKPYPEQVTALADKLTVVVQSFAQQTKDLQGNPAAMNDDKWKASVTNELGQISALSDLARTLNPPAQYVGVQNWLKHSATEYDHLVSLYTDGLEHHDPARLNAGLLALNNGNSALRQAKSGLEDIDP